VNDEDERKFLLVGNPTSGSGKAADYIDAALDAMRERIWYVDFVQTEPEGRTVDVVRDRLLQTNYDTVIALGGDGTFAEVAKGLLAADNGTKLGFLPFGTANDQGKSFGLRIGPAELPFNLDVIEKDFVRPIDVGIVERIDDDGQVDAREHVFHSVGWGMQPDILAVRNAEREAVEHVPWVNFFYRDYAVYAGAAFDRYIASWIEPTKFEVSLVADGEKIELAGLTDLLVNATAMYGGLFVLDRFAEPDDGLFELIPVHGRRDAVLSVVRALKPLVAIEKDLGILPLAREGMRQIAQLELHMNRPGNENVRSQVDGEQWVSGQHFRLKVDKRALPLIVPEEFVGSWETRE